jgi:hypothetical protein
MRAVIGCALLFAVPAHALPLRIAALPLELSGVDTGQATSLEAAFDVKLARTSAIRLAGRARVDEVVQPAGAEACAQNEQCLRELAERTDSLYTLQATLAADALRTKLEATARVLRVDGVVVRRVVRTAPITSGADVVTAGRELLDELLRALELEHLLDAVPAAGADSAQADADVPLRVPLAVEGLQPREGAGVAAMGVGTLAIGAGATLAILALTGRQAVQPDAGGHVPAAQAAVAARVAHEAQAAAVLLPVGVAVVAGGLLMLLLPPHLDVAVAAGPRVAGLSISGSFP